MSGPASDETLSLVRNSVRNVLTRSEAFRALPPEHRRHLAHDMVKVARYIVDAGGETTGVPMNAIVSTGLADPPDRVKQVEGTRKTAKDFKDGPGIGPSAGKEFTDLINKVDFPRFVGGLVEGVFNAIVSSSIRQMEAYSTLVSNIAKSVDEYMRDNVTPNQARDYLAGKYPDHLKVETTGGEPKLRPVGGRGAGGRPSGRGGRPPLSQGLAAGGKPGPLPDFMKDLGLPEPIKSLNDKTIEDKLVPAARRRMAMDRQQLLATMVLMGINRLIVMDGRISASCLFELDTRDVLYQDTESASSFDETARKRQGTGWWFWFVPTERSTSNFTVSTSNSASSESEKTMHAQLAGNVDINFRSETFPLEKMADVLQIRQIEEKAPQAAPAPAAQGPGIQLPPPPPLPPLPSAPGQNIPVGG